MKIVVYNVNGLKSNLSDPSFSHFLNSFHIFALLETHILAEQFNLVNKHFSDYDTFWIPAEKMSKFGRPCGGMFCGISRKLKLKHTFSMKYKFPIITFTPSTPDLAFTLIPIYLTHSSWVDDLLALRETLVNCQLDRYIVMGDCNSRIGDLQEVPGELVESSAVLSTSRASKDSVINKKGKDLVEFCADHGLIILNGRCKGDEDGHYTFVGALGASVIDVCLISAGVLPFFSTFQVLGQPFSDHFPIALTLKCLTVPAGIEPQCVNRLKWVPSGEEDFKKRFQEGLNLLNVYPESVDTLALLVSNLVKNSWVRKPGGKIMFQQEWFDFECFEARKKCMQLLKLLRLGKICKVRLGTASQQAVVISVWFLLLA